jgi:hypothetical protein
MFQVYCPNKTNRVIYTVEFVFNTLLQQQVEIITNKEQLTPLSITVNYSSEELEDSISIVPTGLLHSTDVTKQVTDIKYWHEIPTFFQTNEKLAIPFDLFSAVFFLITRMEEYNPIKTDEHNRFVYTESAAFKHNFLQIPIVDLWCYQFIQVINKEFNLQLTINRKYNHISTIDIDNAYAFRAKGLVRNILGTGKSITKFDFKSVVYRWRVLLGLEKDPYDTYALIEQMQQQYADRSIYFFPVGDSSAYDRHLLHTNNSYQQLIKEINSKYEIGLHPTYANGNNLEKTKEEADRLSDIIQQPVDKSRYHFLRFTLPLSYQQLATVGITEEYSMGYAGAIGFRAGTCTPFFFYNLTQEQTTSLKVYPFQVMDATLNNYLQLPPELAMRQISALIEQVRKVDGTFVTLWHNESISDRYSWENWQSVFTFMMKQAKSNG